MPPKTKNSSLTGPSFPIKALVTLCVFFVADFTISKFLIPDDKAVKRNQFSNRDLLLRKDGNTPKDLENDLSATENTNVTAREEFESKHAIILISFGQSAAESTLLERCILSIRRRGDFNGRVVVITDAPEERYDGEFDKNVIVLQANEADILYDYFKAPAMKYKRFKTLLIRYVDSVPELDSVEWLYYVDIDMMLGTPFIDVAQNLHTKYKIQDNAGEVSSLYMFKDPNADMYALNTGFIIINRHFSNHCLHLWRIRFDEDQHSHNDQKAVNEVIEKNKNNHCDMNGMDVEGYLTYPKNDEDLIRTMLEGDYSPFIHVFNTCFAKRVSAGVMELFVADVLRLSDEEKREHKFGKEVILPSQEKWKSTAKVQKD